MPLYEYEHVDDECLDGSVRFEWLQSVREEPLAFCPTCGLPVRRVVSRPGRPVLRGNPLRKAGEKGFTKFRRVGKGQWEKVYGPGVDAIVGSQEDIEAVEREARVVDLDAED